jgi:hypothetical protein
VISLTINSIPPISDRVETAEPVIPSAANQTRNRSKAARTTLRVMSASPISSSCSLGTHLASGASEPGLSSPPETRQRKSAIT